MRRSLFILTFLCIGYALQAQKPMSVQIKTPVVCYATAEDHPHYIPPPLEYFEKANNTSGRTNAAVIEVTYIGFESVPQAQQAFQRAVDIWSSLLTTSVPIRIEARWTSLGQGVLASANYTSAYANFKGAQKLNVFYPVGIAEKITGMELNDGEPDIFANFNSSINWHFNPDDPNIPTGKYDLTTVVLHEIGHGLGFSSTFSVSSSQGVFGLAGTGIPIIYDVPIERASGANLIETIVSPSVGMATPLTSNNLFFDEHSGRTKLYAPATFDGGSSISHVDESTFNSTTNALMTPQVAPQEQLNHPGIALEMLNNLGWEIIRIEHNQLPGSENVDGPYAVNATIVADNDYEAESVKLHYTTNGSTFTEVIMTPSGANMFTANIPGNGIAHSYGYYISVDNTEGFQYVNPGKVVRRLDTQVQDFYVFETGPDTKAPIITHVKKPFLLDSETEVIIDAEISDNTGVITATLEYFINDVQQPDQPLTLLAPAEDSIYAATLDIDALINGDVLKYRIVAVDQAANPNTAFSPPTGYHILNIVGLEPTQESYENDFESSGRDLDFFGTGYTITQPAGFNNRAIHSEHPYISGNGFPGNERELIYQLRYPIQVKATEATLKFDEIVLVEPGDPGSVFGNNNFYDYVIVEGSIDGGLTWEFLLPGYDARTQAAWLTRYNSAIDVNGNSTAIGDPALYRPRTIDLLQTYEAGDEVVIRFRTYIDQLTSGWGWTIDNLKIQIDDTPPIILHDHRDYLIAGENVLQLISKVSDPSGIESYALEYVINDGDVQRFDFDVDPLFNPYEFSLSGLSALEEGDLIQYRFVAIDKKANERALPASGYFDVPVINFSSPVAQYSNNFNSPSGDFVGNFFSIAQPNAFTDGAIHTDHPYATGFGLDLTSNITYTLKKPITVSASNSIIKFNEIVLVEGHSNGVIFGTTAFNDYVIVEGSTDGGETWNSFENGYDAVENSVWITAFNNGTNGNPSFFRSRIINMRETSAFETGDDVVIRFRLFSNATVNGWGWAIDDVYIQDPITGIENELDRIVSVYPNPAIEKIVIEADASTSSEFNIQLLTVQGQKVYQAAGQAVDGKMIHTIAAGQFAPGMYFVKISNGSKSTIRKVMKTN